MDRVTKAFTDDATAQGYIELHCSDLKAARANHLWRECRTGKLPEGEGKGVAVKAYYYDELGNIVALCADGFIKQFLK